MGSKPFPPHVGTFFKYNKKLSASMSSAITNAENEIKKALEFAETFAFYQTYVCPAVYVVYAYALYRSMYMKKKLSPNEMKALYAAAGVNAVAIAYFGFGSKTKVPISSILTPGFLVGMSSSS